MSNVTNEQNWAGHSDSTLREWLDFRLLFQETAAGTAEI